MFLHTIHLYTFNFLPSYKDTFNRLRTLKTEIEHLQHLLEKAKVKLMKDFELWWAEQAAQLQVRQVNQFNSKH